jgi:two-component system chemotaxis response regulator CheY
MVCLAFLGKTTKSARCRFGGNPITAYAAVGMDKRLRVLVVDDSKVMRGIIRKMLGPDDTEVLEACDGKHALELLAKEPVDCIISDWNMPRMQGIELLRRVRGDGDLAATPFVMVTAEAMAANVAEAEAANVSSYLTKPFTADDLWRTLRTILPDRLTD